MSKLVCHVQKFQRNDVRGLQIHNQRESDNSKNKEIDRSKTHLNYDLNNDQAINYTEAVKDRLKTLDKTIRKDAVVMASVMVTAEHDFFKNMPESKQKEFFKTASDYLTQKFGQENVITATVHMDEKTPHMHFQFVPITEDRRLCAKELTSRKNLTEIQNDLPKALQRAGFAIERGQERSRIKHMDTEVWKRQQADMELKLESRERELQAKAQEIDLKQKEIENKLQQTDKELQATNKRLDEARTSSITERELIEIRQRSKVKSGLFSKEHVELSIEDYNKLVHTAVAGAQAIEQTKSLDSFKRTASEVDRLRSENSRLSNINRELQTSLTKKTETLNRVQQMTYKKYLTRGLDDKQCAIVMLKHDGFDKKDVASVIGSQSPNAPSLSNEVRSFTNKIIADALKMDSHAVALAVSLGRDENEIDWSALTPDQAKDKMNELKRDMSL